MSAPLSNWAGNVRFRGEVCEPESLDELRTVVTGARSVRAFGSRHSFNDMPDAEVMVGFSALPDGARADVDAAAMTVTVGPGVTFAQLAVVLNGHGLALANLASLPHISVCGAIATATHGSGLALGNLATSVRGLTLLTSGGEVVTIGAEDPRLAGAAVHLGALGIVLSATLAVVPYYEVSQSVYLDLEWEALFAHFDEVFALGRSVSVFHALGERVRSVWVKAESGASVPAEVFGARAAAVEVHPLPGGDATSATAQLGVPGPWSERLPHFRSGFTPSDGEEIQSEVFVGREDGVKAIEALLEITAELEPVLLTGELRTIAADELWLSPHYRRDSLGLHFTWQRDSAAVAHNVALIEAALAPFAPRPHWGKVFSVDPAVLGAAYPRAGEFAALRAELDPRGGFINPWMREHCPWLLG